MLGFMRDKLGFKKIKTKTPENYLSTYFFLSRVFHQVVRTQEGAKVKYSHMVDFLTEGKRHRILMEWVIILGLSF